VGTKENGLTLDGLRIYAEVPQGVDYPIASILNILLEEQIRK
jgi:hypothetical protein